MDLARVSPNAPALDLCCGTGDLAFALAQRGADVTGLDFSAQMLEVAATRQRKIPDLKFRPPKFLAGDVRNNFRLPKTVSTS